MNSVNREPPGHDSLVFDVLVVGAGVGGMAAAARLKHAGYRTLLVERRDRVGGRASTAEIGEFTVNTGALIFELGGENQRLFDDVGADHGVLVPELPLALRTRRREIPLMSGPGGRVFQSLLKTVAVALRRVPALSPRRGITLEEWLRSAHAGRRLMGLMRNVTCTFFGVEPHEVEAAFFADYLVKLAAVGAFGSHPEGSIGPWRALAEHYQRTGGELWLESTVQRLTFDDEGLACGAVIDRGGEVVAVAARAVVSDAGPPSTVALCGDAAPEEWAIEVADRICPTTIITINFATRDPLPDFRGMALFSGTRRLAYGGNMTALSPKLVPNGWHVYACSSVPQPSTGEFDHDGELAILKSDLRLMFPDFDSARILSVEVCSGSSEWPGQWTIAGRSLPNSTPISNLWNVGDGVYEWATTGQSGCVETARKVVEQVHSTLG